MSFFNLTCSLLTCFRFAKSSTRWRSRPSSTGTSTWDLGCRSRLRRLSSCNEAIIFGDSKSFTEKTTPNWSGLQPRTAPASNDFNFGAKTIQKNLKKSWEKLPAANIFPSWRSWTSPVMNSTRKRWLCCLRNGTNFHNNITKHSTVWGYRYIQALYVLVIYYKQCNDVN